MFIPVHFDTDDRRIIIYIVTACKFIKMDVSSKMVSILVLVNSSDSISPSSDIVMVIKSCGMKGSGHVASTEEIKNEYIQ
jgi:hypothetical protein